MTCGLGWTVASWVVPVNCLISRSLRVPRWLPWGQLAFRMPPLVTTAIARSIGARLEDERGAEKHGQFVGNGNGSKIWAVAPRAQCPAQS
jgi:hypothetical protein